MPELTSCPDDSDTLFFRGDVLFYVEVSALLANSMTVCLEVEITAPSPLSDASVVSINDHFAWDSPRWEVT